MVKCAGRFALLSIIALLLLATAASAQIVPVSQDRSIYGWASIGGGAGGGDSTDADTAGDYGHFEAGVSAYLNAGDALSSGSATQNSDIFSAELRADGSAATNGETYENSYYSESMAESRYSVTFNVVDTLVYQMTGQLEGFDGGSATVKLKQVETWLLNLYAGGNQTTPVSHEDTLYPGQYELLMEADAYSWADWPWDFDYGYGSFDIRFQVATSTGIPTGGVNGLFLSVAPNPIRSGTVIAHHVPAGGTAMIDVYDLAGRRVRTMESGGTIVWDGRDDAGRDVAAGVYFVRLQSGTNEIRKKVTVLR